MRTDEIGDLFELLEAMDPAVAGVGHGVNLQGSMGGGIARLFARRYPGLEPAYGRACASGELVLGGAFPWQAEDGRWVLNCASQVQPGADARLTAVADSVAAALDHAESVGLTQLLLPRIGCGIGGLRWPDVVTELDRVAELHPRVSIRCVTLDR
jgi:O-acetyl-ADP-ribose deacetylase (regulator of RNase III)